MKTKTFDAPDMKRRGQEALWAHLEGMTADEQRAFWRRQNDELREWQRQLQAQPSARSRFERAMANARGRAPCGYRMKAIAQSPMGSSGSNSR
jgi:hypothetical protein